MENENKGAVRVEGNKTPRLTFSVSREFESILPEIESMPNMSRFVCEAIYEKLQRTKNPNKDLEDALSHFVQIQSIIGRPVAPELSQQQWTPPVQSQVVPSSPASVQQVQPSIQPEQEETKEQPLPPVEAIAQKQEEDIQETVVQEEVQDEISIEPEVNTIVQEKETITKEVEDVPSNSSSNDEDNQEKPVAIKKARQSYLKSRTP